jgi:hypothetical protein
MSGKINKIRLAALPSHDINVAAKMGGPHIAVEMAYRRFIAQYSARNRTLEDLCEPHGQQEHCSEDEKAPR